MSLSERARPIAKEIYELTLKFPQVHQFSIGEQLRRASLSIALNITESGARKNYGEKKQLLNIAFGSLKETKFLLEFSRDIKIISAPERLCSQLEELAKILYVIIYQK